MIPNMSLWEILGFATGAASAWRGRNLLGFTLMDVRERL
jgi:predicted NAD-dependent protein-ADP-ribosyltransferase YbiA (DUF1768 family)